MSRLLSPFCLIALAFAELCLPAARAEVAIAKAGLPPRLHGLAGAPFDGERLAGHMAQDKKADASGLVFVLAQAIGEAFVAKRVEPAALRRFLQAEGARSAPSV